MAANVMSAAPRPFMTLYEANQVDAHDHPIRDHNATGDTAALTACHEANARLKASGHLFKADAKIGG